VGRGVNRLIETWNSLSPARKGVLTATGAGLLVLALVVYSWSSTTTYVTLYSRLDPSDAGRIVEQLRTRGIRFELDSSGTTVRVPAAQVDELRLDFAAQGLPEGGHVGFEIFEGNSFTATDFVQRLNFQRSLQGELARTIETFPAVERARVHIVMPERSLFVRDQEPATASVVVGLRPGRSLASNEVSGIAHLVAGAVEGLEKDRITILDANGALLYDGSQMASAEGIGMTTTQLQLQQEYERRLQASVQSMLDRALGVARSAVSVSAVLNFDRVELERESFAAPEGGTPRSSSTVTETYSTEGQDDAGQIPGALTNVPGANANLPVTTTGGPTTTTNYQRTETTSNFEVDRTVTRQVEAPGKVMRMSVSLLLDESVTPEQAEALSESVAAAVGIDESRGDRVVVTRLAFDTSVLEAASQAFAEEAATDKILTYARMALPFVMLLVAFIFFRLLVRSVTSRAVRTFDMGGPMLAGAGGVGAMPAEAALRALPPPSDEIKRSDLEVSVHKMASTHPETVAEVVQSWLREE
jgi:flagellar M-ring protein FliF